MKSYKLNNLEIGTGRPKVGAWLMGSNESELISEAKYFAASRGEFAEWHLEYFESCKEIEAVVKTAESLAQHLNGKPLVVSYRTTGTAGNCKLTIEELEQAFAKLIQSNSVCQIDFELSLGVEFIQPMIELAHQSQVAVSLTDHYKVETPECKEIVERFYALQRFRPDAVLLLTYPETNRGVLELLAAIEELRQQEFAIPYTGLACHDRGTISRIAGETFGSAMTYGSAMKVSVPGKIPVNDLYTILNLLHINGMH